MAKLKTRLHVFGYYITCAFLVLFHDLSVVMGMVLKHHCKILEHKEIFAIRCEKCGGYFYFHVLQPTALDQDFVDNVNRYVGTGKGRLELIDRGAMTKNLCTCTKKNVS